MAFDKINFIYSYEDGLFPLTCTMLSSIIVGLQLLREPLPISTFPSGGEVEGKWRVDGRTSELSFHSTLSICTWLWEMKSWLDTLHRHRGLSAGRHIFSAEHFRPLAQSRGKEIRQETTNTPPWHALFVCSVLPASIWTVSDEDYLKHLVVPSTCHMLSAVCYYLSFWWMTRKRNTVTFWTSIFFIYIFFPNATLAYFLLPIILL